MTPNYPPSFRLQLLPVRAADGRATSDPVIPSHHRSGACCAASSRAHWQSVANVPLSRRQRIRPGAIGGLNMPSTHGLLCCLAAAALVAAGPAPARCADSAAGESELPQVLVSGYRQSLEDAQSRKRAASQIV